MHALRSWSFGKVLLACVAWFLLSVVVMIGWVFFQASGFLESGEGSSVGAVLVPVNAALLAIPSFRQ